MKDNIKFFEHEGMMSAGEASAKEVRHGFYDANISEPEEVIMQDFKERMKSGENGRDDILLSDQSTLEGFPDDRR